MDVEARVRIPRGPHTDARLRRDARGRDGGGDEHELASRTAATINRRRFGKAVVIVDRQVGRQAVEIRGCGLTLHNVMVIEINRCPRSVEERNVHDRQVIEMCEEFVTINAHFVDVPLKFTGTNAEMGK